MCKYFKSGCKFALCFSTCNLVCDVFVTNSVKKLKDKVFRNILMASYAIVISLGLSHDPA